MICRIFEYEDMIMHIMVDCVKDLFPVKNITIVMTPRLASRKKCIHEIKS